MLTVTTSGKRARLNAIYIAYRLGTSTFDQYFENLLLLLARPDDGSFFLESKLQPPFARPAGIE
jgi:hypothetical protein